MNMLYTFTVDREVTQTVEEETEKGTLVKKQKVHTGVPIGIKKPSRSELDELDMIYARNYSACIRDGILTRDMLAKAYANTGGLLTEDEKDMYKNLYENYTNLNINYQALSMEIARDEKTNEKKEKQLTDAASELFQAYSDLQRFEQKQAHVFDQTAEVISRNKTLVWAIVNLTYVKEIDLEGVTAEKWEPMFIGETFEKKLDYYDAMLEADDKFFEVASTKIATLIGAWYSGNIKTPEEFEHIDHYIDSVSQNISLEEEESPKKKTTKKKSSRKKVAHAAK